ncbi:unnamed protein product [Trichobilharzia regenti]|nr:unnamed protein product [Trichobilharzia regenti]
MELKELQGLGPMDYCLRYCFLSTKRTGLYQRIYSKMKDNRHRKVNLKVSSLFRLFVFFFLHFADYFNLDKSSQRSEQLSLSINSSSSGSLSLYT